MFPRRCRAMSGRRLLWEPRAYLGDAAVLRMSLEARGAYSTLLMAMWETETPGILPHDDTLLACLARATPEQWERVKGQVLAAFISVGDELHQLRMTRECVVQERRFRALSRRGKKARATQLRHDAENKPTSDAGLCPLGVGVGVGVRQDSASVSDANAAPQEPQSVPSPDLAPAPPRGSASPRRPAQDLSGNGQANPELAAGMNRLVVGLSRSHDLNDRVSARPLFDRVSAAILGLALPDQKRIYGLVGWLSKHRGLDHELILRYVEDAMPRLATINSLYAYYAATGPASATLDGHYRADSQEAESRRWRAQEWAWMRQLVAQGLVAEPA